MARRVQHRQQVFSFPGWGGARDGAGRPREKGSKLRHEAREQLSRPILRT
jgi:hypothetical protein